MATDSPVPDPKDSTGEPAREMLTHFTHRLIALARSRLDGRLRQKVDPEDVVQSVYKSFLLRYGEAAIVEEGMESLWGLLTVITLRKCAERARYYRAERRDLAREASSPAAADGAEP